MKVLIDIPKKEYDIIKNYKSFMPWAEGLIKKGVAIPEGATNGEVLKVLFEERIYNALKDRMQYTNWWNAPYISDCIPSEYDLSEDIELSNPQMYR